MSQDRANVDTFLVRQAFLSFMPGARRVGITGVVNELLREGLIEYHCRYLSVLNRNGLEATARSRYAADKQNYRTLLG